MSMQKKAAWLKKQMYKDLYKDQHEINKKKYNGRASCGNDQKDDRPRKEI